MLPITLNLFEIRRIRYLFASDMGAFDYSIEQLLSERGIEPKYRRQGYGMYLSPLRNESTPSFKVDYNRNLWYDFGIGQGGGPVDLCMKLDNLEVRDVLSKLSGGNFVRKAVVEKPSVRVLSESLLDSTKLLDYVISRGISYEVARGYCTELCIAIAGKRHLAIGFRNDDGGWEIRNDYLKISTSPKTISTFMGKVNQCHVFEGFMDYLSFLSLGGARLEGSNVVLNSVNNLSKCSDYLKRFSEIYCWLDNDKAGRNTFDEIRKMSPPSSLVVDCARYYLNHKDLNDFLIGKQVEGVKESPEKINRLKL